MGRRVKRKRGDFLRLRIEVAKLDLPLEDIVPIIRLIDDYLHLSNLRRICRHRKGSIKYNDIRIEIKDYESFIQAREVMNEVKYNNSRTGEL